VGEVTEDKLKTVRAATAIVEQALGRSRAFQYFAVLLNDYATGIRDNRREFGQIIVVRCINSTDARKCSVTRVPWATLERISRRSRISGREPLLVRPDAEASGNVEYV